MVLGIVLGWSKVDARVLAGTFLRLTSGAGGVILLRLTRRGSVSVLPEGYRNQGRPGQHERAKNQPTKHINILLDQAHVQNEMRRSQKKAALSPVRHLAKSSGE